MHPGQPRPQLRQGRRHAQPARRSRAHPLSAAGATASAATGKWERVTWDEALDDIGGRIRKAIVEDRRNEVMYHVGRPGEDGYANRVLQAWGVDGHNSHTNVCSSSARARATLSGRASTGRRPTTPTRGSSCCSRRTSRPATTSTRTRSGSSKARSRGATSVVIDPRLSNTSAKADLWLPPYPGTEAALLLAMANVLLDEELYDREFVRRWVNWEEYLRAERPDLPRDVRELHRRAEGALRAVHAGVRRGGDRRAGRRRSSRSARAIGARRAARSPRTSGAAAAAGNLWGWQMRALPVSARRADRQRRHAGRRRACTSANKFVPKHPDRRRRRRSTGTSCSSRGSTRWRSSR